MKIVLLGAPGAGKGTYARILSERYNIPHISTGDLLRDAMKRKTEVGIKAKPFMDSGHLVPDELVLEPLKKRIGEPDAKQGFLLDGYPRNVNQANTLAGMVGIQKAIAFEVSPEVAMERIGGRRTCRKCASVFHIVNLPPKKEGVCDRCGSRLYQRSDETPDAIKVRLETYKKETAPLVEYYQQRGLLIRADANPPYGKINEVLAPIVAELDRLKR